MRIGGLFEGYGGLTMGVQAALGGDLAWYSEVEPAAVRLLEHHHPTVPNIGDVTTVKWDEIPRVDVLTGGVPCQDVSSAGRRAGMKPGTRSGLWAHMARAIDVLRPNLVVIENVRGLLSAEAHSDLEPCPWCLGDDEGRPLRALGRLLGDLADIGFDARWCGLRAADAGAPHARYRVFIAAWPADGADAAGVGCGPEGRHDRVRAAGLVEGAAADSGGVEPERRGIGEVVDGAAGPGDGEGPERERDGAPSGGAHRRHLRPQAPGRAGHRTTRHRARTDPRPLRRSSMILAEQQQLIRDAIAVLNTRPDKWDTYLRLTLSYALSDHEDPDEGCPAAPGECLAVATARRVLAGEA